jgi:hypothetical protein
MSGKLSVPVLERDYIVRLTSEPDPARKLDIYASAIAHMQQRLGPLLRVLQAVATFDAEPAAIWEDLVRRRARNMPLLIEHLASVGALRADIDAADAADAVWALNSSEVYVMLTGIRGWSPERYQR